MTGRGRAILAGVCILHFATVATAQAFVEWVQLPYTLTLSENFTQVNQARTGFTALVLHHDVAVTVQISEPEVGGSQLRSTAPGSTDSLGTSYKLSGVRLTPSDGDWIDAADFVGRAYTLSPAAGEPYNSSIQLDARGAGAANRANDTGEYSATITVTATEIE